MSKRQKPVKKTIQVNPGSSVEVEPEEAAPEQPESQPEPPPVPESESEERKSIAVLKQESKLVLKPEHLYRVEMLYGRMQNAQLKKQLTELKAQKFEMEMALTVRALRADASLHDREAKDWKSEARKFMLSLNDEYGIDFQNATYDDESGAITMIDPETGKPLG